MPPLVADLDRACPGFVPNEYQAGSAYGWVAGFIRHLARKRMAGAEDEVRATFEVIEKAIAGKGPDSELAIVGFLEDLQNMGLHPEGSHPARFEVYLGAESRRMWDQLNGFWHAVAATKPKP